MIVSQGAHPNDILITALAQDTHIRRMISNHHDTAMLVRELKEYLFRLPRCASGPCRLIVLLLLDSVDWEALARRLLAVHTGRG